MKRKPMTRAQVAQKVWQVLISAAHNRQVITYELLAGLIDMGGPGTLAYPLGCVMYYCQERGWPALTVLVVKKKMGRPGTGLTTVLDQDAERERVFAFEWFKQTPPSIEALESAHKEGSAV